MKCYRSFALAEMSSMLARADPIIGAQYVVLSILAGKLNEKLADTELGC